MSHLGPPLSILCPLLCREGNSSLPLLSMNTVELSYLVFILLSVLMLGMACHFLLPEGGCHTEATKKKEKDDLDEFPE